MAPKKSKTAKKPLKKTRTMAVTIADGKEFLQRKQNHADTKKAAANADTTSTSAETNSSSTKPSLNKTRTMQTTTKEAKVLLGEEVLADTRAETKRRQAAVEAKKTLEKVKKKTETRKPALKRLGTMAKTANEGKAYLKRTSANRKKNARRTKK